MDSLQAIFSDTGSTIVAIFLLGFTIFVHEFGHFLAAKKRGAKIERFSIGFGPKIFGWVGRDGIEYRLSWIPLGGYVSLPQLAEMPAIEGETKNDVEKLPPLGFLDKVIVAIAGPVFNVLFAMLLATVLWAIGQQVAAEIQTNVIGNIRSTIETSDGKTVPGPAAAAGLNVGDRILAVDGQNVSNFSQIVDAVMMGSGRAADNSPQTTLTVKRDDRVFDLIMTPVYSTTYENHRDIGITPSAKILVASVIADSAAQKAGLKPGDLLTHIDQSPITSPNTIRDYISKTKDTPVEITYQRDGLTAKATLVPRLTFNPDTNKQSYLIGITQSYDVTIITVHIPPWTQIGEVFDRTGRSLAALANPRTDVGLKDANGPLGMIDNMRRIIKSDYKDALWFVILINVALAVFNMLPIPVLDGGHILLAIITKIRGRALPVRIVATVQSVMVLLLFSLMIFVTFNDGRRILRRLFTSKPVPAQQTAPDSATPAQPSK
jgi:regulator of sigma E protease